MNIAGVPVIESPLAVAISYEIQRSPIRKRRRNYRVVRVQRPGCYQMGNTFVVHPELMLRLKEKAL